MNTAPIHDGDILFNPPLWKEIVASQERLFCLKDLFQLSDRLRDEFYFGHGPNREMPEIHPSGWNTRLLNCYKERHIGYDLPCLLSAERTTKGRIMLCAQDPLRGPGPAKLTVGTFFGIDSHYHRTRRHWGMIWRLIRYCVLQGYDVWVTDALKIYAGPNVVFRDSALRELCFSTIREEVAKFNPDKVIAFGAVAGKSLRTARLEVSVVQVAHPTARGVSGPLDARFEDYIGLIFG